MLNHTLIGTDERISLQPRRYGPQVHRNFSCIRSIRVVTGTNTPLRCYVNFNIMNIVKCNLPDSNSCTKTPPKPSTKDADLSRDLKSTCLFFLE